MFRTKAKKEIISILQDFHKLHQEIIHAGTADLQLQCMALAQENALQLGNQIEKLTDQSSEIIGALTSYCEILYKIAQNGNINIDPLDQKIDEAITILESLPSVRLIYFLPYKASMWDSLESIYLAAAKDPAVKAIVMPIPYYEFDNVQHKIHECYEGNQFPSDIPIENYKNTDLSVLHPDAIYIHNPYDDDNYITSVNPRYFSKYLKVQTDCLIYVPYYVTSGFFGVDQQHVHAMRNISFMVVQSQHFKDDAIAQSYYDRLLPLGSPKLDKVIKMCSHSSTFHPEWSDFIAGRKVVMLNTSINAMLHNTDAYLTKLEHLFDYFQNRQDIALIWRPHPLLHATLLTSRTAFVARYESLVKRFISCNIGILDTTASIEETIAVSDAYIGDNATSVINLFGAAGKPLHILNNYILHAPSDNAKRRIRIQKLLHNQDGCEYVLSAIGLCKVHGTDFSNLEYLGSSNSSDCWHNSIADAAIIDGIIYIAPYLSKYFSVFDTRTNIFRALEDQRNLLPNVDPIWSDVLKCRGIYYYKNTVVFLSTDVKAMLPETIIMYDIISHRFRTFPEPLKAWKTGFAKKYLLYDIQVSHSFQEFGSRFIYAISPYSNLVLQFNIDSEEYRFLHITENSDIRFLRVAAYRNILCLLCISLENSPSVSLLLYNIIDGTNQFIKLPYGGHIWLNGNQQYDPVNAMILIGEYLYLIPGFSDLFFKVSIKSGMVESIASGLFRAVNNDILGCSKTDTPICIFAQYIPKRGLFLQRSCDYALFLLNPSDDAVQEIDCSLSNESLKRIYSESDGFEKDTLDSEFSQKESTFYPLNDFLNDLTKNPKKMSKIRSRQMRELQPLANNLDGTCGEKTHQKIMEILEES
jgi:hypothetical protein